jgi:hypothetical protein
MPLLCSIYRSFVKESTQVLDRFDNVDASLTTGPAVDAREGSLIRLHDAWARFCQELIVTSALGTVTMSGTKVPRLPDTKHHREVLPYLRTLYKAKKPPWWEPRWHDATECIEAGRLLGLSSIPTIQAALGAASSPAEDLRKLRNFVAHRGQKTAEGVVEVASALRLPPMSPASLVSTVIHPGTTVLHLWVSELSDVAEAASQ